MHSKRFSVHLVVCACVWCIHAFFIHYYLFLTNLFLIPIVPLLFPHSNKCPHEKCCESLPCPPWECSHPLSCCVLPIKEGSHCLRSVLAAPGTAAPARPHCDFRPHTDGPESKYSCTWLDAAPAGVAEWTWRSAYRPLQVLGVGGADRAQMLR